MTIPVAVLVGFAGWTLATLTGQGPPMSIHMKQNVSCRTSGRYARCLDCRAPTHIQESAMSLRNNASRGRKSPGAALRSRVAAAFRAMARGTDPATAFARTKMFYRSGTGVWARSFT